MQRCNNLCERIKVHARGYTEGIRRCTICDVYLKTGDRFCPCCKTILRIKPRWNKSDNPKKLRLYTY